VEEMQKVVREDLYPFSVMVAGAGTTMMRE